MGLPRRYEEDNDFRQSCGKVDALSFLPQMNFRKGWNIFDP